MIQIKQLHIEEIRGIRHLTLALDRDSFVISGPNGSGKSGVVDAIQFALTGEIGRLMGTGTGDLKLSDHGPHVDRRSDPDAALVKLDVFIPSLDKCASITRSIKKPKSPSISPDDDDVKAVFDAVATHPEIILSRREIIKFILTEAGQRSRDVQTLLKLDDVDQTRGTLKTVENRLGAAYSSALSQAKTTEESLKRHLDLPELRAEDVLAAVNKRRKLLGVPEIATLAVDTSLSDGIPAAATKDAPGASKASTLRDLEILVQFLAQDVDSTMTAHATSVLQGVARLEENPDLLSLIMRQPFLEMGLDFVVEPMCPLCDTTWDPESLREHLRQKLERSRDALTVRNSLLAAGQSISNEVARLRALLQPAMNVAEAEKTLVARLAEWLGDLRAFSEMLLSVEGIIASKRRVAGGWAAIPAGVHEELGLTIGRVKERPDESATVEARDFLVLAQERFSNWQREKRESGERQTAFALGKTAYKTYCDVAETELAGLYSEVEGEFGEFYRFINSDDEGKFKAKFEPSAGKLGLLVDFYQKGMFPPGAYHSEGHQDGMGVCLYLALVKRVLGSNFTIAVLDDVVMSVDAQHRKQFCKLLKGRFPDVQFIITTHDQVWAKQMRSHGLVKPKSNVAFHTWTVETGPVLDEITEIWDQVEKDLDKNEVPTAAARLRRHLEYVASDLADELGGKVSFKADGSYDMGELLGAVIGRQGELLKEADKAAKSWDDEEQKAAVKVFVDARAEILAACGGEQWIINKAVHYNEWADLSKEDFRPVVTAFKCLLGLFRCDKPKCDSWMTTVPRNDPTDLRCDCGNLRLNLKRK